MSKVYNEKYDVVHKTWLKCIAPDPVDGQPALHQNKVDYIYFYMKFGKKWQRIELSREFIVDLNSQIELIESDTVMAKYESLPF